MKLAKEQHEAFAQFFEKPTREGLRDLIKQNIGETDYLDFKSEWPDLIKVSKHILALANSGGGIIVIGLKQTDDGHIDAIGLNGFLDKAVIGKTIKKYVPSSVQYDVLDFSYKESEYATLKGKFFQVVVVEYSEKTLPILCLKDGTEIKSNVAYIREGTESKEANHEKLEHLLNLRIESGYSSSHTLNLVEHLDQLRQLYKSRDRDTIHGLSSSTMKLFLGYTLEEYYEFVEEIIESKKSRIEKVLDI